MVAHRLISVFVCAAAGIALSSCGGGGGGGGSTTPPVAPSPTPGPLSASPAALSFTGAQQTLTVTVSEANYQGTFMLSSNCTNVATVGTTGNGPQTTLSLTSVAAGTCSVNIADHTGEKTSVGVTVTTGSGTVQ